jgi:hypothetical protein
MAVGSDAASTLSDPTVKTTLAITDRQRRDARPWADWEVEGWPTTALRPW